MPPFNFLHISVWLDLEELLDSPLQLQQKLTTHIFDRLFHDRFGFESDMSGPKLSLLAVLYLTAKERVIEAGFADVELDGAGIRNGDGAGGGKLRGGLCRGCFGDGLCRWRDYLRCRRGRGLAECNRREERQDVAQGPFDERRQQDDAHEHDSMNGVRTGHQGCVQRGRHLADHLEADQ